MNAVLAILTPLVSPLGMVFGVLVLGLLLWRFSKPFAQFLFVFACCLLFVFSSKLLGQWSFEQLESQFPAVPVKEQSNADYIVVLGGGIGFPETPRVALEFRYMGDRLLQAARLYRAGKAPKIVVSGGNANPASGRLSEAEYAAQLLLELGVPATAVVLETNSSNTAENAAFTADLLSEPQKLNLLLVTSAFHMPRAMLAFSSEGFQVIAAPTDFYIPQEKTGLWNRLVPSSTGLALFSNAFHEWVSLQVYRLSHYR